MRAQEFIRALLTVLDSMETDRVGTDDEKDRFRQIDDLIDQGKNSPLSNAPNEQYADVDSVTINAGGGVNGPKHPHDIRGDHISLYPNQQEA